MNTLLSAATLVVLILGGRHIMAQLQEVRDVLNRLNTATNAVAEKLRKAADQVASGGLTTEEETSVVSELRTAADRLEGLAANPEEPVPAEPAPATPPTPPQE